MSAPENWCGRFSNGEKKESVNGENRRMGERINSYKELRVFENAMNAAMKIFEQTKSFPPEEKDSMVDQMR